MRITLTTDFNYEYLFWKENKRNLFINCNLNFFYEKSKNNNFEILKLLKLPQFALFSGK